MKEIIVAAVLAAVSAAVAENGKTVLWKRG